MKEKGAGSVAVATVRVTNNKFAEERERGLKRKACWVTMLRSTLLSFWWLVRLLSFKKYIY